MKNRSKKTTRLDKNMKRLKRFLLYPFAITHMFFICSFSEANTYSYLELKRTCNGIFDLEGEIVKRLAPPEFIQLENPLYKKPSDAMTYDEKKIFEKIVTGFVQSPQILKNTLINVQLKVVPDEKQKRITGKLTDFDSQFKYIEIGHIKVNVNQIKRMTFKDQNVPDFAQGTYKIYENFDWILSGPFPIIAGTNGRPVYENYFYLMSPEMDIAVEHLSEQIGMSPSQFARYDRSYQDDDLFEAHSPQFKKLLILAANIARKSGKLPRDKLYVYSSLLRRFYIDSELYRKDSWNINSRYVLSGPNSQQFLFDNLSKEENEQFTDTDAFVFVGLRQAYIQLEYFNELPDGLKGLHDSEW